VKTVQLTNITVDSLTSLATAEVKDDQLVLTLTPGQAVRITPQ
jgi:hypothetical protein